MKGINVKRKLSLFVAPIILMAANSSVLASDFSAHNLTPYVGIDVQFRQMSFDKNHGNNVFRKNYPQGNVYAGLKFNDYIGVEAGFEGTNKRSRNARLFVGQYSIGGDPVPTIPGVTTFEDSITTAKIHGPHINVVGTFPILDDSDLALIGSVGISRLKVSLKYKATQDEAGPLSIIRTFAKRKSILRLGGGIQHMITDCVGVRGMVTWQNTAKFKHISAKEVATHPSGFAKLKNSFSYGLGVFINF
jgi:hypothetical protein